MRIGKIIVFSLVLGIILTIISLIYYENESMSDLEIFKYGFPIPWLFHQTISIIGPIDIWSVEWLTLFINLAFWGIISTAIIFTLKKLRV